MSEPYKTCMRVLSWLALIFLVAPLNVMSQDSGETAKFSKEELTQMLAPIALYPDSLLSQILMASTYPIEIVQADRWVKQNPNLKGDALDKALKEKDWDVSVKSLCHYPDVLSAMSQNLDQTTKLGDAFLSQQKEVMDTIQELRAKAQAQGNLKTTEQQKVIVDPADPQVIVIEPANPEVVYVPTYNTAAVYGPWWYPAYPPYSPWYYPAGSALVGGAIGFGIGYAVGSSWGWSDCDWGHGDVNVDIDRTNNFNKIDRDKIQGGREKWQHNQNHRKGVAYRDKATSQRFGQSSKRSLESRREARGYGELGSQGRGFEQGKLGQRGGGFDGDFKGSIGSGGRGSTFKGTHSGGRRDSAFSGMGSGRSTRISSNRGYSSRGGGFGGGGRGGGRGGGGRRR
ncbi:MAG: DUF3300 domain-containing protein [Candidatus Dadabacteria bacterium]|nr:DUF3300 domain-containing protein [Candidatus Dadabacteria bacterium]